MSITYKILIIYIIFIFLSIKYLILNLKINLGQFDGSLE